MRAGVSAPSKAQALAGELVPAFGTQWAVKVLPGPQEAPEYFTAADVSQFYEHDWEVSHNASRLGVRLVGPKPTWARADGGGGGSHPSNLHDNAYAIGSINFTGDHPVVLMVDGPSLGGFVCAATIPLHERWKMGQVKPGDTIRFHRIGLEQAMREMHEQDHVLAHLKPAPPAAAKNQPGGAVGAPEIWKKAAQQYQGFGQRALVHERAASGTAPRVQYRMAGERYLLVEYGPLELDLNLRFHVHSLEQWLLKHKQSGQLKGLTDTIPGVRTLLIQYEPRTLPLPELMRVLDAAEHERAPIDDMTLRSRVFRLPMAFRDQWNRAAIERYRATVRATAPYLPDNVDFMARNNGLAGAADVERIVFDASYMVLGLGDVYLGAPCAVPVDPRHRLVVPKYNPARTFTPEGAVGIGGTYMCIYPMESPGGYQLIGRTLPIWNTRGNLGAFSPAKPWLLDMFDQVRFQKVSDQELEAQRAAFSRGELKLAVEDTQFSVKDYNRFLAGLGPEVAALQARQKQAAAIELRADADMQAKSRQEDDALLKVLRYLAAQAVNGPDHAGAIGSPPSTSLPIVPPPHAAAAPGTAHSAAEPPRGLKQLFDEQGAKAFARAVRQHRRSKGLLLTDTTWRDAHQSLLATRVRTTDLEKIAKATAHVLANAYSIECWGGATFDVALRFLHECPFDRLQRLRELVPNVPFQMLLRGANAVGYTSYPDNVVYEFCKASKRAGMDVFRVFDSVNYIENMKLGIDAVGAAGGIVEAAICYSGDVANPNKKKYTLDYYLDFARQLVARGVHVLCVKDMAGLLKPRAATMLIGALRHEFPDMPIHVHCHDTAGTGVASMLACAEAGADAVDVANDAMSGLTSQPNMGALVYNLQGTELDTGVDIDQMQHLTTYWEGARRLYNPFESGQKSAGADVYTNEIPGGQYTNLQFQALSLGLAGEWDAIKRAYAEANQLLGDIIKVTPSSKVVGDLAQFMVTNKLDLAAVQAQAERLNFPSSVVEFLQGYLGIPYGGFPEPFRSKVLKNLPRVEGRPGASMKQFDFAKLRADLENKYGAAHISDYDLLSAAQYPKVFQEYKQHHVTYGDVTYLPTRQFLQPMEIGEEFTYSDAAAGRANAKQYRVKLLQIKPLDAQGHYPVVFEVNGQARHVTIKPSKPGDVPHIVKGAQTAGGAGAAKAVARDKADKAQAGQVGAPMPGKVVDVKVSEGKLVEKGDPIAVLSAMKMETVVSAPCSGRVSRVLVRTDDMVAAGDLLLEIIKPTK